MAEVGSIQIAVFTLAGSTLDRGVLEEVRSIVAGGTARIVDAVLAEREADGALVWAELADQVDSWGELSELIGDTESLVAAEDLAELTSELALGEAALVVAFENTWLRPLLAAVRRTGGRVVTEVAVPEEIVLQLAGSVQAQAQEPARRRVGRAGLLGSMVRMAVPGPARIGAASPAGAGAAPATVASADGADLPGQLQQLAGMLEAGLLTEAEFAAAKARLLG